MAFRVSVLLDAISSRLWLQRPVLGLELSPGSRCLRFVSEVGSLVVAVLSQMWTARLSGAKTLEGPF